MTRTDTPLAITARSLACPACHAAAGLDCITPTGRPLNRRYHKARTDAQLAAILAAIREGA